MPVLKLITALGKWQIYIVLFLVAGLYCKWISKNDELAKKAWFLLSCIVLSSFVNCILKITFSRARPELLFSLNEYGFYWFRLKDAYWSLPSGHAVTITALAAGLSVAIPRSLYFVWVLALLVLATRVLLYYHYLSDVVTGFYVALLIVGIITLYFKKYNWLRNEHGISR
jgi:membrane-associated phospholipid phosphatase